MSKNKRKHLQSKRKKFESKAQTSSAPSDSGQSNPFEFHRNKVKHNIIGRKVAKNELGNKALSRNRAFNKRKNTLLHEYQRKHKSGRGVLDLSGKDNEISEELKNRGISSMDFSGENTELTHKGRQLDNFIDDTVGSDDDDIDVFNRPEFIESAHFGGGTDGRPKSANEVLDQIMDEKREKQLEKAANVELTKKLDTEWSAIKNILKHKGVKHEVSNTKEDFDVLLKELMFDSRSRPAVTLPKVLQSNNIASDKTDVTQKSVRTLFNEGIQQLEQERNWKQLMSSLKELVNQVSPQIDEESLYILTERYQTIIEEKSLNANNLALLLLGTNFKQTKTLVTLILSQYLSKVRFNSFKDVALSLTIIKALLLSSKNDFIPEVFASILNIIGLTQKQENPNSVESEGKKKFSLVIEGEEDVKFELIFYPKYAFDSYFDKNLDTNETQTKQMLVIESLRLFDQMLDLYMKFPSLKEMTHSVKRHLTRLSEKSVKSISRLANEILSKLNKNESKKALAESRPKPFILPMFEPKFDDSSNLDKKNPKKKLMRKYKRELKGAQRELRKDSVFIRSTWINEIQRNDRKRKDKVKEIMGDLAQQQGLYKKKKKHK